MNKRSVMPMLAVLYASAFVAAFNENIINVALVSIMNEFSVDANTAQWLVTGYMVITAIVVTITAFLSKRLRLRTLFYLAAALLVGGSLVCMIAPTFPLLLAARLVQSIGTGIFIPVMMSTVLAVAPRKRMGTYLSIGGCMITFGPAFAPVVSGLMVTTFGWRSVFIPPTVIVVLLAIAGSLFIKNIAEPERIKLDILSVILSAIGLFALVYGLSILTSNPVFALVCVVVGLLGIAGFALRQTRIPYPVLDMSPLKNPRFSITCFLVVVAMMTTFSMSVLLPLYFEAALGMTAFASGALLLAPILVNAGTSLLGGRTMDKRGTWPLLPFGFALIACGQVAICLSAPQMLWVAVLIGSIVVYAGVGFIFTPSQTAGLQTLTPEQHPHGVAIINTFIQVAASIGPSLFVGVLSSTSADVMATGATHNVAQAQGFATAVTVAALIAVAGFVVAFVYARTAKRHTQTPPADTRANADANSSKTSAVAASIPANELSIASVMKAPYLVRDSATVRETMLLLIERRTSGLPIVNEHHEIVGFITDGDILKTIGKQNTPTLDLATSLAVYRDMRTFDTRLAETLDANVMEIATTSLVSVTAQTSIDEVCSILSSKRIKKVPVLEGKRVVGTISRSDVVRALMGSFAESCEVSENNEGDGTRPNTEV